MTTLTQKQITQTLDDCAARADMIDRTPATSKQRWFLAGLILKQGEEMAHRDYSNFLLNTSRVLTKGEASTLITEYLKG